MRQKSGRANAIARAMALKDESTNGADVRASARGHQPYRARPLTIGDLMALEPALRRHQGLYELLPNNVLADIEGAHRADKRTTELERQRRLHGKRRGGQSPPQEQVWRAKGQPRPGRTSPKRGL